MGKKPKKRDSKTSGGGRKVSRINQQIRKLKSKIARWERYREEIEKNERTGPASRWDTSGLQKHMELLESLI